MEIEIVKRDTQSCQFVLPNKSKIEFCILGGTGFIGKLLVTNLLQLGEDENKSIKLNIVTRNVQKSKNIFARRFSNCINWIEHDLNRSVIKNLPMVDYYVHGPTPSVVGNSLDCQKSLMRVTLNGTKSIKESIKDWEWLPRVVNLSSGAVYSKTRSVDSPHFEADQTNDTTLDYYARAKIESEKIFQSMNNLKQVSLLNLRLFSFYGPFLPLNRHFAIGNFMQDVMLGRPLLIKGNSGTKRSFLYSSDLATALIRGLFSDYQGNLNIGGRNVISMGNLANLINSTCQGYGSEFLGEDSEPNYYYPSVSLSEEILGPYETKTFEDGLNEWKAWLLKSKQGNVITQLK